MEWVDEGMAAASLRSRIRGKNPINAYARRKFSELRLRTGIYRARIDAYLAFSRELLTDPRDVGAVCPSSPYLAQAMAAELRNVGDGLVVELGAGTGSITRALLQQGVAPERLILIERSAKLAVHLRKQFPFVRVIEGDARELNKLLGSDAKEVKAVVSGLPLRSMSAGAVSEIVQQLKQLLTGGGILIQFTYDLRPWSVCMDTTMRRERTRLVWKNLPPARVNTFVRATEAVQPVV